ncbi:MAG: hypothetical protein V1649_03740 [Patescibacteria group bacterium]
METLQTVEGGGNVDKKKLKELRNELLEALKIQRKINDEFVDWLENDEIDEEEHKKMIEKFISWREEKEQAVSDAFNEFVEEEKKNSKEEGK